MVAAMLRTNENDNAAIGLRTTDLRNIAIGLAAAIALIMVAGQISDSGSASATVLDDAPDKRFGSPTPVTDPSSSATEDVAYSSTGQWVDSDGAITFTFSGCASWMTCADNNNGGAGSVSTFTISGTPADANVGATTVTISGAQGGQTVQRSVTITVSEVNDEPTATASAVGGTFTEDGSNVDLFSSPSVGDGDSQVAQTWDKIVMTITNVADAEEYIVIDGSECDITASATCVANTATNEGAAVVSLNSGTATLTWTADDGTIVDAEMVALIDALAYKSDDQSPTNGNRVITITQLDDEGSTGGNHDNSVSLSLAATVTVAGVDDDPAFAGTGNTGTYTEDAGGTVSDTAAATDADGETITYSCTSCNDAGSTQTLTDTYGAWVVTEATGAWVYTPDDTDNDLNSLNAAEAASETLTMIATDASGGTTDSITITITITGANDAPTTATGSKTTAEDTLVTLADSDFTFNDVDDAHTAFTRIYIKDLESSGDLECYARNGVGAAWADCQDEDYVTSGAYIRLTPATDSTATVTFNFCVYDGVACSASTQFSVTVTPSNDAPTISIQDDTLDTNEDTSLTMNTGGSDGFTVADAESATLTVTLATSAGTLTLADVSAADFSGGCSGAAGDGTTDTTMTFCATPTNTNTAVDGLVLAPASNSEATHTITITVNDGVNSAVQDTIAVTINAQNDAPTASDATVTALEDATYTFSSSDFGFTDVDSGASLKSVTLQAATAGTLWVDSDSNGAVNGGEAAVQNNDVVLTANIAKLKWKPAADASGTIGTFAFIVTDNADAASGSYTMTLSITAVNDEPTLTATGLTPTFAEDGAAKDLFSGPAAGYGDTDGSESADRINSLTITVTNVADTTEYLTVDGTACDLTDGNSETTSGNSMTCAVTLSGSTATVALSHSGLTSAAINTIIDAMTYENSDQSPTIGSTRVVTITAIGDDGGTANGGDNSKSVTIAATVTLTKSNDLPTSAAGSKTITEDQQTALAASDFTFTDLDGDTISRIRITTTESAGDLECNNKNGGGGGWTDCATNDYVAAGTDLRFQHATDDVSSETFSFEVHDGTGYSSAQYVFTISITPVNDAPANAGDTATVTEDTDYNSWTAATDWGWSDVDSGDALTHVKIWTCPTAGTMTVGGSACDAENSQATLANLNTIVYSPVANSDTGNPTFTYKLYDGDDWSAAGTMTLSFSAQNDAPSNAGDTATVTEDAAYTSWTQATDWGWSEVDTGDTLESVLFVTCPSSGTFTIGGVACNAGVSSSTLGNLNSVSFTTASNSNAGVTFTYKLYDGEAYSAVGTMTISVTPQNDAPSAGATADQTIYEDVAYSFTTTTSTDVDGDTLTITCEEQNNAGNAESALPAFIAVSNQGDGTAVISGTAAHANLAASDDSDSTYNVLCTTTDNGAGSLTATDLFVITVTEINDAPVLASSTGTSATAGTAIEDKSGGVTFTLTATDEESNDATFAEGSSCPAWMTVADGGGAAMTGTIAIAEAALTDARVGDHDCDVTITDGTTTALYTYTVTISEINDEPTLTATGASPTHTEGSSGETLYSNAAAADSDSQATQTFTSLTLTVTNVQDTTESIYLDGGWESLAAMGSTSTTDTNSYTYQITGCSTTCTVALTGMTLTATQMQTLVDGLKYKNTDDSPTDANRVVTITQMTDSGGTGGAGADDTVTLSIVSTVNVDLANDAPDASGASATIANIAEDTTNPGGSTVSAALSGVTDADAGSSVNGIVICSYTHDAAKGTWAYEVDASGNWVTISTRTDNENCLGIEDDDKIRFVPAANHNGAATTLSVIVVDNTQAIASGTATYDASSTGGTTAFSSNTVSVSHSVTAVNDAPIASGSTTLTTINEDATPTGQTVTALFASNFADSADSDALAGICISSYTSAAAKGVLSYSQDGSSYSTVATVAALNAGTTIRAANYLKFTPTADYSGTSPTITVVLIEDSGGAVAGAAATNVDCSYSASGIYSTATVALTMTVNDVNDEPTLTVTTATPTFTEDGSAVSLYSNAAAGYGDTDGSESADRINSLTITITNVADTTEYLNVDGTACDLTNSNSETTSGNSMTCAVTVSSGTATVTLTHSGLTSAAIQTIVDAMTYENNDQSPTTGSRVVTITAIGDDGGTANGGDNSKSVTLASTVTVASLNDAPTASGSATLAAINEDATASGATVSSLFTSNFADTDGDAIGGVCLTSYTEATSKGQWKYSTNDGGAWTALSDITAATAGVYIRAADELAFVPAANWNGAAPTMTATLSDDSGNEPATAATTNCATTGTTTVYSTSGVTLSHTVNAVNDAPTVSDTTQALSSIAEDGTPSTTTTVSNLFSASFADSADSDGFAGVCIISYSEDTNEGQWKWSNDGSSFTAISTVSSDSSGLILDDASRLQFDPASNFNGAANTISVVLVEDSGGALTTDASADDCSSNGGSTVYSADGSPVVLSHSVSAVNDAPTSSGGSSAHGHPNEDATYTFTTTESHWGYSDVESTAMATVDFTTLPSTGTLMYSGNAVTVGQDIAAGSLGGVTYVPVANANGAITFTFKTTDGSDWQSSPATYTITYAAVNDAPDVSSATATISAINEDTSAPSGSTISSMLSSVSDVDSGSSVNGVVICSYTHDAAKGTWAYTADGSSWSDIATRSDTSNCLGVEDDDSIRFVPAANYAGAATALSVHVVDNTQAIATGTGTYDAASTGGTTAFSAALSVSHTITAVDDAPAFSSASGSVNVNEGSTAVGTYTATDAESDSITYTKSGTDASLFAIGSSDGVLTFSSAPNYESPGCGSGSNSNTCTVIITATANSKTDTHTLTVNVQDLNDESPVWQTSASQSVDENTRNVVATLSVTDGDSADSNTATYAITSNDNSLFEISSSTLRFAASGGANYESPGCGGSSNSNTCTVTVRASDGASSANTADRTFTITIGDLNDQTPSYSRSSGDLTQNYAEATTTAIDSFSITDTDTGNSFSCNVGGDDSGDVSCSISSTTVTVSFASQPNYESPADNGGNNVYDFTISVSDASSGGNTGSTLTYEITVTDTDEFDVSTPTDSNSGSNTVAENAADNAAAGITASASDSDGTTNTITYSMVISTSACSGWFDIGQSDGIVRVDGSNELDYETVTSCAVVITATSADTSAKDLSTSISITDVNDQTPAATVAATYNVAENVATVASISVTDTDTSGTLACSVAGTDSSLFTCSISSGTATLAFASAPNFESAGDSGGNNVYDIQVTFTDGANTLGAQTTAITVTDANEAPSITSTAVTSATEDAAYSYTVQSSDPDDGDPHSNSVTITCTTGCSSGAWLSVSGAVLSGTPGDDEVGSYSVVLTASDGSLTSTQSFSITVTNVNDAGSVALSGTAAEDSQLTATPSDDDNDGSGDTYTYAWQSSSDLSTWSSIGSNSNTYTLTQSEVGKYVRVTVSYTDDDGTVESHSTQTTSTISNVNDANTAVPTISGTLTQGQTLTASPAPLSGNDEDGTTTADASSYAGYSYQWQSCTTSAASSCSNMNGKTSSTLALSNDEVGKYMRVVVSYTDDQSTAESVNSAISAVVGNINDAASISGANTGSVTEDASSPASGTPTVTDPDSGENTLLTVSAGTASVSGYGTFGVSSGTWTYTLDDTDSTVNALIAGASLQDTFVVTSADGSDTMTVTITITGANDAATIGGTTTGTAQEDTSDGSGTLTVTDVDTNQASFTAVSSATDSISGYGTYTITTAGVWAYTLDDSDSAVQALAAGASMTDTFSVTSADGTAQTVTITISGLNDAATIGGDTTGTAQEDTSDGSGTLTVSDTDSNQNTFTAVSSATDTANGYGTYTITTAGVWAFTLDDSDSAVQALAAGASMTDTFSVTSADNTAQTVTITISGLNDAATIGGATTGTAQEDTSDGSGTLTVSDTDSNQNTFTAVSSATDSISGYGTYTITTAGVWAYTLDDSDSAVQALAAGSTLSDSFSVTSADGTAQTVSITISGLNDAATFAGDTTGTAQEDTSDGSGTATVADTDTNQATFTASSGSATYGTYAMATSGAWTYTLDDSKSAVQALTSSGSLSDSFSVTSADGTAQTISITISGLNDAPSIDSTAVTSATEDSAYSYTVQSSDTDTGETPSLTCSCPSWATFTDNSDGTASFTGTPLEAHVGSSSVTITAADSATSTAQTFTLTVANTNDDPTGSLSITGTAQEDEVLGIAQLLADEDGLGTFSYQWKRDGTAVSGATGLTYTLGQSDVGSAITITISYTDGHDTAESVTSAATSSVQNINDASTVAISGTATEDQTLTATVTDEDGATGTITYEWRRDGTAISGATASTHLLTQTDVGTAISVYVSFTDDYSNGETATSSATSAVANVNDNPTGTVTITGTATEDQTLTASDTLADEDGLGSITYTWSNGATGSSIVLGQTDVGNAITVTAAYTDGQSTAESVASSATSAVANVNDSPTGAVTITGTPTEDQTLTASNNLADEDGMGTVSYAWSNGATGSSIVLGQSDVGSAITVTASYTDGQLTAESVASSATAAVANVNDAGSGLSLASDGDVSDPDEDDTLSVTGTLSDEDGCTGTTCALTYAWSTGETSSTIALGQSHVGETISVTLTYSDDQSETNTITLTATSDVDNVNDSPTGAVTITGTPTEDQTLTASDTLADEDGIGAITYTWSTGATGSSIVLGQSDVGNAISVTAAYQDSQGTSESVASSATAAVANVNDAGSGLSLASDGDVSDPDEDDTLSV
ncbi:MAG: beta strand repeat-containing protein, partial [Candidatus Thalassarchaeum sp.]